MARPDTATSSHGLAAPLSDGLPLRIMPLGASITWGYQSSDGNGYRADLRAALAEGGNPVQMVGSRRHGAMADNAVEGWPGYVIRQVHARANWAVPRWRPNVVLVNAGTNDCAHDDEVAGAGVRMAHLLADLWAMSPRATVVLSSLLPNADKAVEARLVAVNAQLAALAVRLRAAGRRLVFADMHGPGGPRVDDLVDGTHPGDAGYAKMAVLWHDALVRASDAGMLQWPEPLPGDPDEKGMMT